MKKAVFVIFILGFLATISLVKDGNILAVEAAPSVYQGDLILTGNNITVLEDRFNINGSIIVEENATLILRNILLNFTQVRCYQFNMTLREPANGNPRLVVENATITSNLYFLGVNLYGNSSAKVDRLTASTRIFMYNSSSASVSNSTVGPTFLNQSTVLAGSDSSFGSIVSCHDSKVTALNCTIQHVVADDNSEIDVTNCTIKDHVQILTTSANYTALGLKPGFVRFWDYTLNCSVVEASGGKVPNVTLENTKVGRWEFISHGGSNATISNCELSSLWADESTAIFIKNTTIHQLYSMENSRLWLVNSVSYTLSIYDQSEVYIYWFLNVHVVDSTGQEVLANVTATHPNSTVVESKLTDANGWTRLTLMEKMINATGEYPVENYTIEATNKTYSDETTVNITGNQEITLRLAINTGSPNISDVNRDGVVDIFDVVVVAKAFGSNPGGSNWNPLADLVQDEIIDIFDVVLLAKNFGKNA